MIDAGLIELLACPWCGQYPLAAEIDQGSPMSIDQGVLICASGRHRFGIHNGLPELLPEGISPDLKVAGSNWSSWRRKLGNFVAWRQERYGTSDETVKSTPSPDYIALQSAFFTFCGLDQPGSYRRLLDIGSAADTILPYLDPSWQYCGLDPMPLRQRYAYWMVQAMGEHLPMRDCVFDHVLIMQTLDHCANPGRLISEAKRVVREGGKLSVQQVVDRTVSKSVRVRVRRWIRRWLKPDAPDPTDVKMANYSAVSLEALLSPYFQVEAAVRHGRNQVFIRAVRL